MWQNCMKLSRNPTQKKAKMNSHIHIKANIVKFPYQKDSICLYFHTERPIYIVLTKQNKTLYAGGVKSIWCNISTLNLLYRCDNTNIHPKTS